jgi:hypothetical protein
MSKVKILVGSNYTERTILQSKLTKEGDRAVDQLEFQIPKNEDVAVNDELYYQQDFMELNNLSLCLNLQGNVKDESGIFNHGSATAITYEDEEEYYGKQAIFNGSSSFISVPDNNNLDLSGEFDIYVWAKWTSTTNGHILDKRGGSYPNGYAISVNKGTAGDVVFKMGGTTILSSSNGYNDGNKHLIRVSRNSDNLVTLYVDGVSKGTATITYNGTNTNPLLIGKGDTHETGTLFQGNVFQTNVFDSTTTYAGSSTQNFFNGKILRLRIYKGIALDDEISTIIKDKINPRSTLKFGGYVTKIDVEMPYKRIIAQSFGKVLVETEVRGQSYEDKTPEHILNDLITNNTSFTFDDRSIASGLTVDKFIADGKLFDIIRDFASFTNRIFYTTPTKEFVFEPAEFNYIANKTFTHGTGNIIVNKKGFDDTKLVNQLTLIGETQEFSRTQSFTGNGNNKVFTIDHAATTVEVKVGGTSQTPSEHYEMDTLSKEITFTTAPANSASITVDYDYEIPMVIKGERATSITKYGTHAKKIIMSWITNRTDGVRFVQSYLNRYAEIQERTSVNFASLLGYLSENDVMNISHSGLGISGDFAVKSISWTYPQMNTEVIVGEYFFDFFEDDQEIVRKLHDFEGAITTSKEIQDYESPEELLAMTDVVIQVVSEDFSESLSMTATVQEYEKTRATYGSSKYGSRITQDIYGDA